MATKKKQVGKKKPLTGPSKQAIARWREFGGAPLPKKPQAALKKLLKGIGAFRQQAGGGPANPLVVVVAREVEGSGCGKRAEIGGFYDMKLAPGQACIGAAAVKAVLDAAAAKECCDTLTCPKECPCEYTPQVKLAIYRCANGHEEGYLLQGKTVWNCRCHVSA